MCVWTKYRTNFTRKFHCVVCFELYLYHFYGCCVYKGDLCLKTFLCTGGWWRLFVKCYNVKLQLLQFPSIPQLPVLISKDLQRIRGTESRTKPSYPSQPRKVPSWFSCNCHGYMLWRQLLKGFKGQMRADISTLATCWWLPQEACLECNCIGKIKLAGLVLLEIPKARYVYQRERVCRVTENVLLHTCSVHHPLLRNTCFGYRSL